MDHSKNLKLIDETLYGKKFMTTSQGIVYTFEKSFFVENIYETSVLKKYLVLIIWNGDSWAFNLKDVISLLLERKWVFVKD